MASFIRSIPDDTIRQWQASAEPAPPPAAPVVTITLSREDVNRLIGLTGDRIADLASAKFSGLIDQTGRDWYGREWKEAKRVVGLLEAALRGADLASESEGARDGQ